MQKLTKKMDIRQSCKMYTHSSIEASGKIIGQLFHQKESGKVEYRSHEVRINLKN